jgi:hypothetical protein
VIPFSTSANHVLQITEHRHHQALCTLQGELVNTSIGDTLLHISIVHVLQITEHRHHQALCTLQGELENTSIGNPLLHVSTGTTRPCVHYKEN